MARARLHIICGNCGCNDMWTFRVSKNGTCIDVDKFEDAYYLSCGNCATLHNIKDNAEIEKSKD